MNLNHLLLPHLPLLYQNLNQSYPILKINSLHLYWNYHHFHHFQKALLKHRPNLHFHHSFHSSFLIFQKIQRLILPRNHLHFHLLILLYLIVHPLADLDLLFLKTLLLMAPPSSLQSLIFLATFYFYYHLYSHTFPWHISFPHCH